MNRLALVLSLALILPAHAEQKVEPVQEVSYDWQAYLRLQTHVQQNIVALATAYQKLEVENARLKAELEEAKKPHDGGK